MKKIRIALLGTRGIPARYGGFETFAEEISKRLVERGHPVTVYARKKFFENKPEARYGEVSSIHTSTIMHKYLETPLHAITSFWNVLFKNYDIILLCNAANSPFAWMARLKGIPVVINVDGIERLRSKWNSLGKLWYKLGERCSVLFASRIVSDAKVIAEYYKEEFQAESEVIAYGAEAPFKEPGEVLKTFGLEPGKFILYVSRLEPENNALGVIEAYNKVDTEIPLVIVGDAPYADDYKEQLRSLAKEGVVFTGFQFGDAYHELRSHCSIYIQATEVGGTHPALIEGMAYGNCIIANGTPENIEVLGEAGSIYAKNDFTELAQLIQELIGDVDARHQHSKKAKERAEELYNWDVVTDQYERLFQRLCFDK